jgi:hypothetical protein
MGKEAENFNQPDIRKFPSLVAADTEPVDGGEEEKSENDFYSAL